MLSHLLVAIAALAAGFYVGGLKAPPGPPAGTSVTLASTGIIPRASPLHDALEKLPGGVERLIEAGVSVKPVLSYASASGVWCRRFELRAATGRTDAVACRGTDEWRIATLATGPPIEIDSNDLVPKTSSVVDAAVAATIDGEPLDLQEELEVLVRGWAPVAEL